LASGFLAVLWLGQGAAQAAEITVLGGMGVISGIRDLTVRDKWRKGVEAMDVVTNALDNSLRLAAYTAARRNRVPVYIIDALLESTESRSCKQPLTSESTWRTASSHPPKKRHQNALPMITIDCSQCSISRLCHSNEPRLSVTQPPRAGD
jgi:hypothetical protein